MADDQYTIGWHPNVPDEHGLSEDSLRGTPDAVDMAPRDRYGNDLEREPLSYHEAVTLHNAGRGNEIPLDQFGTPHGADAVHIGMTGVRQTPTTVAEPVPQYDDSDFSADEQVILSMIPDRRQRDDAARRFLAAKQDKTSASHPDDWSPRPADDGGSYRTSSPGQTDLYRPPMAEGPPTSPTADAPAVPRAYSDPTPHNLPPREPQP